MENSKNCDTCFNKHKCEKRVNDMQDIKPSCYVYCEYQNLNHTIEVNCKQCSENYNMRYDFCCLNECGEHEFCKGCNCGIYLK